MEAWQAAGSRVRAEWDAMLAAAAARSERPAKLPFVPLELSGRALAAVLEDLLPTLLRPEPGLLTVIEQDGRAIKAYAEDASRGFYEKLVRLEVPPGAGVDEIRRAAEEAGARIGVVKRADVRFFEPFAREPGELVEALALFVSAVASALRDGLLALSPEPPAAGLVRKISLGRETIRLMLARLLPEGAYGLVLSCTNGTAALVVEVAGEGWRAREVDVEARSPGGASRELVDRHGCAAAAGVSLADVRRLVAGEMTLADFIRRRGEGWGVATRSGLEGLVGMAGPLAGLLGLEDELAECNLDLDTVLALLGDYWGSAAAYAREKGVGVRVSDGAKSVTLLWDSRGVREEAAAEPLEVDWSLVRGAVSWLGSDPLGRLGELVPRGVVDYAGYETVVALLECSRPRGRLVIFGGPHRFFSAAWEGDACAVFVDARGNAHAVELPSRPLEVEDDGRRLRLEHARLGFDLRFRRTRTGRRTHGLGRYFAEEGAVEWLPGLDIERALLRLDSGRARLEDVELSLEGGWLLLERGSGRLLRWPFGATWHYASWLFPEGECGAAVRVAPMLGDSTPRWLRRLMQEAVDGAVSLSPVADGPVDFEPAVETGDRVRLVRDAALVGGRELRYEVLSAAVAPFDEEGQTIFRLRCLCGRGAGLVEVPATLPGREGGAEECAVSFTPETISFQAGGRELLLVERAGSRFLAPYAGPAPGALRRAARRLFGRSARPLFRAGG